MTFGKHLCAEQIWHHKPGQKEGKIIGTQQYNTVVVASFWRRSSLVARTQHSHQINKQITVEVSGKNETLGITRPINFKRKKNTHFLSSRHEILCLPLQINQWQTF